jgi:hypothetical protein
MTSTTELLQKMVAEGAHIEVLRGPTAEYITVCRKDRSALFAGDLPREIFDDLRSASLIYQDGEEDGRGVSTFRLTSDGRLRGS